MAFKSISNSNSSLCGQELLEITGLCTAADVTTVLRDYPYWIQMYIPETLEIPPQKPDIETINSVNISVDIMRSEVIVTPVSQEEQDGEIVPITNLEGRRVTGRKLIIEGTLCQKVTYTAALSNQPVHSAHFYVPFSSYIVVPLEYTFPGNDEPTDSLDINYDVNYCIEDLSVCVLDNRRILKQVTLLLYAVPNQSC